MMEPHRPPNFGEGNPHITTVPLFMRLREHHCISPQEPIAVGGENDGFDDGLPYAWMPKIHVKERAGRCSINDGSAIREYETFVPGKPNSHNEDTCTACARGGDKEATRLEHSMAMEDVEETIGEESEGFPEIDDEIEDAFESAGLGYDQNREDDDDEEEVDDCSDGEDDDSYLSDSEEQVHRSCNGIVDIFFTGEVSLALSFIWLVFF